MRTPIHPLWALLALGVACAPRPAPKPESLEPSAAWAGTVVDVVLHGQNFLPDLQLDFDRPSHSKVVPLFTLRLADTALEDVVYLDATTLHARVPGTLGVGTWPLTVVDPLGVEAELPDAFTVTREPLQLFIESAGAGVGVQVGDVTMRVGQVLSLQAVARRSGGAFAKDVVDATWEATAGSLSQTTGAGVEYTPNRRGTAVVTASHPVYGADSTGTITALACTGPADCADACHSTGVCTATGVCQLGAADKDSDRDGYVDGRCPGGTDCNDEARLSSPAGVEGPAGSPSCSDGLDNDCNGFRDEADPACSGGVNTAPIARLSVSPDAGIAWSLFTGDGSASSDAEDPPGALTYEWDWNGDGRYDTVGITSSWRYRASGSFLVVLRVTDTAGARATASTRVVVTTPSVVTVTTPRDENDSNATPGQPGDAGLSLREAITWTNNVSGAQTIVIPPGMSLGLGSRLPGLGDWTTVQGNGASIDATGVGSSSSPCLVASGDHVTIEQLTVFGCGGSPLELQGNDGRVTTSQFHHNGGPVLITGEDVTLTAVEVWRSGRDGIDVQGQGARIADSAAHDNTSAGILVEADQAALVGNRAWGNTDSGLRLTDRLSGVRVLFNTLHGNRDGLSVGPQCTQIDARDNIFSNNQGWGVESSASPFSFLDANDFFQNSIGACRACGSLGARSLQADPLYTNAAGRDFTLRPGSPLINAGVDVGENRNGPAPGNFNGAAPDMGAFESP